MNDVKPTAMQKKVLEIKRDHPEMPLGKAMIQAGYSEKTAQAPGANFLERRGTQIQMEKWREQLRGAGLGEDLLIRKYQEWINATKIKSSMTEPDREVPDYETQLKAKDDLRRDLGLALQEDKTGVSVQNNILIIPSELIAKYEITPGVQEKEEVKE